MSTYPIYFNGSFELVPGKSIFKIVDSAVVNTLAWPVGIQEKSRGKSRPSKMKKIKQKLK